MNARALYPHQADAIDALKASLRTGHKRPMLQCPTGFGKTVLAASVIRGALAKNNRVIFVVPAVSLIDQTVRSFYADGIHDIGVIQAQHELTNPSMPVQVASVQTLAKRRIPHADLVVIDEAHRWFKFYESWMAEWDAVPFVGLSATPWTRGLGRWYDDLIISATTQDLIDSGFLSPFRVFAPSHPDLTGVRTVAGDYHEGDLAGAMDKPLLVADVVDTWRKLGENRNTLCFAVNRAHANHLRKQFELAGVPAGYIDAYTERDERDQIRDALHRGDIRVVCNVGCLTTGIDWDVRCIVLARPTKSEMLFTQIIGRGLRTAPGKSDCLILDHSDTHLRLGFVTDIYHDRLCDGKRKDPSEPTERKEPLPKDCAHCGYLKAPKVHACPMCGFAPERQSDVEVVDGKLTELDARRKAKNNRDKSWPEKIAFIGQLRSYAESTGKKPGWVAHKYREYTGVWPNDPRVKEAPAIEPTPETLSWIKSQNIRWAKRRTA